jgi:nucleoside-diphosphate-sugar epimerase
MTLELVLGGAGLIGAELVHALRAQGNRVVSLDLKTGADLRRVDDAPFEACDRVWFLAWDTGGAKYLADADKQHQQYKNNCELSVRIFDALDRTARPFLFVTSQLAGSSNAYGLTKLLAEKWAGQLGGKVARLWNVYGWEQPDQRSHVVTDFVLSALKYWVIRCRTTGLERRRLLYKTDCVAALLQLFDGAQTRADIAGDQWLTVRDLADEIARQTDSEVLPGEREGEEVPNDPVYGLPNWRPEISLPAGIAMVIEEARRFLRDRNHQKNMNESDEFIAAN